MPKTDPELQHWLSIHQQVRKQIQRSIALLGVIAGIAVIQGFGRLQDFNEDYQFAREFTLHIQKEGPREEAARLFERRCQHATHGCDGGRILVRLEDIPEIRWEYSRFLRKKDPSGTFHVGGYDLGYASFGLLMFLGPLGLLVVICLLLRTTAKIALLIREKALERSQVQQCLNSVFNERATEKLGEHRWFYATAWVLVILLLAVTPSIFVTMQNLTVINTRVTIDKLGTITPLDNVGLNERTYRIPADKKTTRFIGAFILAVMSLGLLVWRSVAQQLRPRDGPEKETTSDDAT